jgi:Polyketide cyclase / dehydrase and lipid transport
MAKDVGDLIGAALGRAARETMQSVASGKKRSSMDLSGGKGLAAGAGIASLAPLAFKGAKTAKNLMSSLGGDSDGQGSGGSGSNPLGKAKEKLEGNVKEKATEGAKDALPFGGGKKKGEPGVGKGRRMPIQQSMDVPVDIQTVYNEWTQFESWPEFMHRLESVSQEDETHVNFKTKIWGKSKEFTAEIEEQRPDERIKWKVTQGVTHTGVVTFHEVAPRLTRVEVNIDVQPGSLIEKAARGMRHVKRAVRADMHRFKAHVMMAEEAGGEWRGTIDDGDVKSSSDSGSSSESRQQSSSSGGSSSRSSGSRMRRRTRGSSGGSSPSPQRRRSAAASSGSSSRGRTASGSSRSSGSSGSSSGSSGSSSGSSGSSRSSSAKSRSGSNGSSAKSRSGSNGSSASKSSSSKSSSSKPSRSTSAKSRSGSNGSSSSKSSRSTSAKGRSGSNGSSASKSSRSSSGGSSRKKSGSRS